MAIELNSDQKTARLRCSKATICRDLWVDEIFKRLPIKSLGRNRCVCKEWNSSISTAYCIINHHSNTSTPPLRSFLHLHRGECTLYTPPNSPPHDVIFPFQFRDIVEPSKVNYEVVDVINGVVCLHHSLSSSFDSVILWNPAIRRYICLPQLETEEEDEEKKETLMTRRRSQFRPNAIGFGYQTQNNDFKVVRVWITEGRCSSLGYEVYSSQQGLWREPMAKTKAFRSRGFLSPATSCFLNGTIHWLVSTSDNQETYSSLLLMFDCDREEFTTMELPQELGLLQEAIFQQHRRPWLVTRVLNYSGMLSVLLYSANEPRIHLWVMKQDTWNKVLVSEPDPYNHLSNGYVYEESMFLMDDIKGGKYYAKGEDVDIQLHPRITSEKRWRCPPVNWIKLNTYGEFRGKNQLAGVGGVFRDDQGRFIKAFALRFNGESVFETQLRGLWTGIQFAMDIRGMHSLIIETDSVQVLEAVATNNYVTKPEASVILTFPCEFFIKHSSWRLALCYTTPELNKVAQWFAKTTITQDQFHGVIKDVPVEVEQLIANDVACVYETTPNQTR